MTHRNLNYLLVVMLLGMLVMMQATRAEMYYLRKERDSAKSKSLLAEDALGQSQRQLKRQKQVNAHMERWLSEQVRDNKEITQGEVRHADGTVTKYK